MPTQNQQGVSPAVLDLRHAHAVNTRCALVTGATGFVGGELVKALLETSERTLICPVRADSAEHAAQRGANRLDELFGPASVDVARRVKWVRSDLEARHLGWTTMLFKEVAGEIDEVFHCAASVRFDLPIADARRINVDGTTNVFALAQAAQDSSGNFRRFHHVSTAYVAGRCKGIVQPGYLPPERASKFRNTYEQTKAEAERWLIARANVDLPVTIHRPSIIGGHTVTGATNNWNVLYVPMRLATRGMLPLFTRGGRELLDSIGVDFVARSIAAFAEIDTQPHHCHHLTAGPTAFTITDVSRAIETRAKEAGHSPSHTKFIHPIQWRMLMAALTVASRAPKRFRSLRLKARMANRAADGSEAYVPYTAVNAEFDASEDHAVLAAHGIEMPAGPAYLATIIDYALATDFGKHPFAVRSTDDPATNEHPCPAPNA